MSKEVMLMDRTMPRELVALKRRVEAWRDRSGGRGRRIPEEFWREAVTVVRTAGLDATARALRFNYEGLKSRAGQEMAAPPKWHGTEFVALEMPQINGGGAKVVVNLVGGDGEQMRIDVSGAGAMDVVLLAETFWRRRS
jgi:hypothetical protein